MLIKLNPECKVYRFRIKWFYIFVGFSESHNFTINGSAFRIKEIINIAFLHEAFKTPYLNPCCLFLLSGCLSVLESG